MFLELIEETVAVWSISELLNGSIQGGSQQKPTHSPIRKTKENLHSAYYDFILNVCSYLDLSLKVYFHKLDGCKRGGPPLARRLPLDNKT
jgi:hypothetical protein